MNKFAFHNTDNQRIFYMIKKGMVSVFYRGEFVGATVLQIPEHEIANDKLFFNTKRLIKKPQAGEQDKLNLSKYYKRTRSINHNNHTHDEFQLDEWIKLQGKNRGLGTIGIIKRFNARRNPETHGHDWQRKGRSISQGTTPGQVKKNTKMAGRNIKHHTQLKRVIEVNENYIIVKGDVVGKAGAIIKIWKNGN